MRGRPPPEPGRHVRLGLSAETYRWLAFPWMRVDRPDFRSTGHYAPYTLSVTPPAPDADVPELGEVITGTKAGRSGSSDITVADLTGTGVQDTAIATFARRLCAAAGVGVDVNS